MEMNLTFHLMSKTGMYKSGSNLLGKAILNRQVAINHFQENGNYIDMFLYFQNWIQGPCNQVPWCVNMIFNICFIIASVFLTNGNQTIKTLSVEVILKYLVILLICISVGGSLLSSLHLTTCLLVFEFCCHLFMTSLFMRMKFF